MLVSIDEEKRDWITLIDLDTDLKGDPRPYTLMHVNENFKDWSQTNYDKSQKVDLFNVKKKHQKYRTFYWEYP